MLEGETVRDVLVILAAAVVAVPLFQRLKAGTVLGYLAAGLVVGPHGLGLIAALEQARALAELGMVFLLFSVGLELTAERLKVLRPPLLALGIGQVLATAAVLALLAMACAQPVGSAVVIGAGLAMSSTSVVLPALAAGRQLNTRFGRAAFAVLLVQDLAVGPLLVLVPVLAGMPVSLAAALGVAMVKMVGGLTVLIGVGRLVLRPIYRMAAKGEASEILTAMSLLVVLSGAGLAQWAGMSMALGGFAAGLLLAETEFRHQIEADIQPFRALLLGLFFMTVGMAVDVGLLLRELGPVVALVALLLAVKALLLAGLARLFGQTGPQAMCLGLFLAEGGEFSFVLFGLAATRGLIAQEMADLLFLVVALSMALTPVLAGFGRRIAGRPRKVAVREAADAIAEAVGELSGHVLIAGYGRVGRIVARQLRDGGLDFLALDLDSDTVARAAEAGLPVYFGDAARADVLLAARADAARAVVVALDDPRAADHIVATLHYIFPEIPIFARARDRAHGEALRRAGAAIVVPELLEAGRQLGASVLHALDDDAKA